MDYEFQGSPIYQGDDIYVVGAGPGKVIDTTSRHFRIRVAGRTRKVSYNGVQSGDTHQTVFWKNPILVQPAKEATLWRAQREMALTATESIRKALKNQDLANYTDLDTAEVEVAEVPLTAQQAQLRNAERLDETIRKIQAEQGVVNINQATG